MGLSDEQIEEFKAQAAAGTPIGRSGTPEEIAAAVLFLASKESSYINSHLAIGAEGYISRQAPSALETEPGFEEVISQGRVCGRIAPFSDARRLRMTLNKIFSPDPSHRWLLSFTQFVEDHKGETAYRGETSKCLWVNFNDSQ